jgi:hypothetical protein
MQAIKEYEIYCEIFGVEPDTSDIITEKRQCNILDSPVLAIDNSLEQIDDDLGNPLKLEKIRDFSNDLDGWRTRSGGCNIAGR